MELTQASEKGVFRIILLFSIVIFLVVAGLSFLPRATDIPSYTPWLPRVNALLNGTASILLMISYISIRLKKIKLHKRLNITAFVLSALFLVSYVWFHSLGIETKYPLDNPLRPVYLFILITHIILAATILPFVLFTFYLGLGMQVARHRKLARWTFPFWLYVTVTGVVVYLMISPYYRF